jgi:hypothetical protein
VQPLRPWLAQSSEIEGSLSTFPHPLGSRIVGSSKLLQVHRVLKALSCNLLCSRADPLFSKWGEFTPLKYCETKAQTAGISTSLRGGSVIGSRRQSNHRWRNIRRLDKRTGKRVAESRRGEFCLKTIHLSILKLHIKLKIYY